ncbi:hypothetical protein AB0I34_36425 [Kribbella sp. NPDC050281]|uniref:hypothetical protein n=1 Tax=Kribbella sp. NPDC050281 TaxID=3155515 RepID=UPI0033D8FE3A
MVDDVGEGVTRFRPGDEVYGDNLVLKGGFAEYALAPESAIALQGMDRAAAGRRVLMNGAGGGSVSSAIQVAKRLGASVAGADNVAKLDFMRSVGADNVIDYRLDDFTRTTRRTT